MEISSSTQWLPSRVLVTAALLLSLNGQTVMASDDDHDSVRSLHATGDIVSLEMVLERLRTLRPGRVIKTEFEQEHGRYIYELEMVDTEGQVWEYKFDAKTGVLLETDRED